MKSNLLQSIGLLSVCLSAASLNMNVRAGLPSIEGSLSFFGVPVLNGPVASATAITGVSNVIVTAAPSGSFAGLGNLGVSWSPLTFAPAVIPVIPLWTVNTNGLTYSFDATSVQIILQAGGFINLSGSGIGHLTGYADTPGRWSVGIVLTGPSLTFSASTSISATNLPLLQYVPNSNGDMNFWWNALWGQPYQVQTATDLSLSNWTNLGGVITSTNPAASWTNPIGTDPKRFYRVILVP